jgi:proline iminopeptidase
MRINSLSLAVGDIEVACTLVGEGVPVVVLHGAIGLGSSYMRSLDPWGEELQLVYYDQRGSGHTPLGDVRRVSFAGGIEDLEGVREALGLDRIALVGHSAGAHLAALYAGLHPATTSSLVLLNAGPPLVPELMTRFGGAMTARRTPVDDDARRAIEESDAFRAGQPAALEAHQLNTFLPFFRDRATAARVSLGFTEITAANVQAAPERMIGSLGALDPMGTYAAIECPSLVVHSGADPIPAEWSRLLAGTIPDADYSVIENGSHFSHIEDLEELSESVVPWLRKHTT